MQHHCAVAHFQRLFHAVGDHQRGELLFFDDLCGQVQHEGGGFRVQRGGVFVQQQDGGGCQAGHQQADGLALAAGKQAHLVAQTIFQAQVEGGQAGFELVHVAGFYGCAQPTALATFDGQGQVFLDGQAFTGARQRVLEYAGYPAGAFVGGQFCDVLVVDDDVATVHHDLTGEGVEEGGFAGAVAANHGDELALVDGQAHASEGRVFQRRALAEGEGQVGCCNHASSSGLFAGKPRGNGRANTGQHNGQGDQHGGDQVQVLGL